MKNILGLDLGTNSIGWAVVKSRTTTGGKEDRKTRLLIKMGSAKRALLTMEKLIDLKDVYGVSVATQVREAWNLQMRTREHYDWWVVQRANQQEPQGDRLGRIQVS